MTVCIRNQWSNHTGLAAANLWLNNVWVSYRYDIKRLGRPYHGWRVGTTQLIKSAFLGWWGENDLRRCRIVRSA